MDMTATASMLARGAREWSALAGEPVTFEAELIDGPMYAYGSEIACLRLYVKMRTGRVEWVHSRLSWRYCNKS